MTATATRITGGPLSFMKDYLFTGLLAIAFLLITQLATAQVTLNYNASGSSTWTVPTGVTSVTVKVWGAGGGGGGAQGTASATRRAGGGGGSGAYATSTITVAAGETYTVTVGAGGTGGSSSSGNGGNGGSSSFVKVSNSTTVASANGGTGGVPGVIGGTVAGTGGAAGTVGVGTTTTAGSAGSNASVTGSTNNAGAGGTAPNGGAGGLTASGVSNPGNAFGGGGSGAGSATTTARGGGAGANGGVQLSYSATCTASAMPYSEGFNASSIPSCWTSNQGTSFISVANSSINTAVAPATGTAAVTTTASEGTHFLKFAAASTANVERLTSRALSTTGATSIALTFDWWESSANTNATEGVQIQYSTNGTTFTNVGSFIPRYKSTATANGAWASKSIDMPAGFLNQGTVYLALTFTGSTSGNNCYLDNLSSVSLCTAPASQATSLTFPTITYGGVSGSFTAASGSPSGYLVVRYLTTDSPTNPVDATTYTVGGTLGAGTVVSSGTSTTFTSSAMGANEYTFYVYAYNNTSCSGGPKYQTSNPLTAAVTALSCPTFAATISVNPTATPVSGSVYNSLTALFTELGNCAITRATVIELASNYTSTGETFPLNLVNYTGQSATNTITIRPASNATNLSISANCALPSTLGSIFYIDGGDNWIIDGRAGGTGTTRNLTIENTNTAVGSAAIRFINGATNNIVRYATLKSSNAGVAGGTVNFAGSTTVGNSNNTVTNCTVSSSSAGLANVGIGSVGVVGFVNANNTISNNEIFDNFNVAGNTYGIYISDYNSGWTISGNSFYNTVSRTLTGGSANRVWAAIGISPSSAANVNGMTISGNYIGGTAAQCGGSAFNLSDNGSASIVLKAILLEVGTTAATSVQGNTIQNIAVTTSSTSTAQCLISAATGNINIGTVTGNTLGSGSTTSSITLNQTSSSVAGRFAGILCGDGTPGTINVSNNTIGGIQISSSGSGNVSLAGVYCTNAAGTYTVTNNVIGSASTANSIKNNTGEDTRGIFIAPSVTTAASITGNTIANVTATSYRFSGIRIDGGVNTVSGNTISNCTSSTNNALIGITGIYVNTTVSGQSISGNTIHSLSNANSSEASVVNGIYYSGANTGTSTIEKNFIHSLSLSSTNTAGFIYGIRVAGTTGAAAIIPITITNNMIRLGINAAGNSIGTGYGIYGIYNISTGTLNHYFNSIYVGGTVSGTTANTAAIFSNSTSNNRTFQNNILVNARTGGSTGKHYSIQVGGTGVNPTGLTSSNNILQATGSNGVLGYYNNTDVTSLNAWVNATGADVTSLTCSPVFVNATGNASAVDLHIQASSATTVEGNGIAVGAVTTDYDGETRSSNSPTDIGADAGNFTGTTAITISGSTTLCSGTSVTLTSSESTGNLWSNGATTESITVSAAGTYYLRNNNGGCISAVTSITVATVDCGPIYSGAGNLTTTANWSTNSLPAAGSNITIDGALTINQSATYGLIYVRDGGSIVIPSGVSLTMTGNLINSGTISGDGTLILAGSNNQTFGGGTISNLTLANSGTIIQNSSTQISGTVTLGNSQVLNLNNKQFTLLSTSAGTARIATVPATSSITNASQFTQQRWLDITKVRRAANATGNYYFTGPVLNGQTVSLWNGVSPYGPATFNQSTANGSNFYFFNTATNSYKKPTSLSQSLPAGTGVQVWFGIQNFFTNNRTTWSVTGTPNVGNFTMPLTANAGFQLVSNPYSSTIDWDNNNWTRTNVSTAIYVYDWVNQRYRTYNNSIGTNGGTRYLATAQGFFVQSTSAACTLVAKEAVKVGTAQVMQRTASIVSQLMRLQVTNGSVSDEVVIAHRDNATLNYESDVDAEKMLNPATNIYVAGATNQAIASLNIENERTIPVTITSATTGNVTLSTTELVGFENRTVNIYNVATGEILPYAASGTYTFAVTAGQPYRLLITLGEVTGITNNKLAQFSVFPNPATDKATINTTGTGKIEILNVVGQVVLSETATGINEINVSKLLKGIYSVRYNGQSTKLVVR